MIKKLLIIVSCIVSFQLNAAHTSKNTINEIQARNYLEHVLSTLCLPQNHAGTYGAELKKFIDQTTRLILKKQGRYTSFWSMSKVYTNDEVYEGAVGELLSFIEDKSRVYADQEINSMLLPDKSKRQLMIDTVVKNIRNEVLGITFKNGSLQSGTFTDYLGAFLRNRVIDALKEEIKRITPKVPQQNLYATADCPVCLDEFAAVDINRVFLACGHNICVQCLREWHRAQGDRAYCPLCRKAISIQDYAQQVFAPSAPALD